MGRKKDLTPEMKGQVIALIRTGLGKGAAAREVGVSRETVRLEERADPDFASKVKDARAETMEQMAHAMFKEGLEGKVQAAKVWLDIVRNEDDEPEAEDEEAEARRQAALEGQLPDRTATET